MKKITVLMVVFMTSIFFLYANQKPIPQLVGSYKKAGKTFTPTTLFQEQATLNKKADIEAVVSDATILTLDLQQLQAALKANPSSMSLQLPTLSKKNLVVDLVQVDIFKPDFSVKFSDNKAPKDIDLGIHYRGVIQGDNNSLVAISIFEHEVMGFISDKRGNQVLGLLENSKNGEHILYFDNQMNVYPDFSCEMPDDVSPYTDDGFDELPGVANKAANCLGIYLEVDDDIASNKGSNTTSYITGLFNQSATLYANDQIDVALSDLFIWTSSAPYSSSSSSGMLSQFQSTRNSFNGDLGQLLSYQASGGIAAGFSGICASNLDNSQCFSSIQSSYSNVPTYSWSVMVFSHELGHLMGSRHTHACVWNGNNTAIDGCTTTEGSCSSPGNPSAGGTIMSYCHLQSVGINFNNGFGPQPGGTIRSRVANGSCLSDCGGNGPTCSDGIQNGDETGVDCGGSTCPACTCTGNNLNLSITLDNYPGETSWTITSGGTTYASGSGYGANPSGTTINIPVCLANGCYDFNIFDTYGDGICCSYGNGSYSLTGNGNTYASGGQFTTSETTNFCLSSTPSPTCSDGIQNGEETGVDCGGSCPACPGGGGCTTINIVNETIIAYGSGQDNGSSSFGADFLLISNNAWKAINLNYTITANTILEFDFGTTAQGEIHGIGFDDDDAISSDLTFQLYGTQNWGIAGNTYTSFGSWQSFSIPVGQSYTGPANRLFFVADHDGSPSNGNSYFRNIRINEGGCIYALTNDGELVEISEESSSLAPTTALGLYPNPARDQLNLQLAGVGEAEVSIVDIYGRTLQTMTSDVSNLQLNVADLASGMYFLRVEADNFKQVEKFVVER